MVTGVEAMAFWWGGSVTCCLGRKTWASVGGWMVGCG